MQASQANRRKICLSRCGQSQQIVFDQTLAFPSLSEGRGRVMMIRGVNACKDVSLSLGSRRALFRPEASRGRLRGIFPGGRKSLLPLFFHPPPPPVFVPCPTPGHNRERGSGVGGRKEQHLMDEPSAVATAHPFTPPPPAYSCVQSASPSSALVHKTMMA